MAGRGYRFSGKDEGYFSNDPEGNQRQSSEFEQKNAPANSGDRQSSEPGEDPHQAAGAIDPDGDAAPDALQQKLQTLEQEKEELKNRLMRLQADFDNYRKRVRAEKAHLEQHANYRLVQRLLPVIDNLERASSASGERPENIVEGIQLISRQLHEILEKEGVTSIECEGKPFDPNCHEAVMVEESSDLPPNTVLDELQKGYRMKDKVLRASMVKVSSDRNQNNQKEA